MIACYRAVTSTFLCHDTSLDGEGMDSAEERASHHSADPVLQPSRLSGRQSRQSTVAPGELPRSKTHVYSKAAPATRSSRSVPDKGLWTPAMVGLYMHLTAQSLLLTCLYMVGGALAGAGATACDTTALESSAESHDNGAHRLEGRRHGAG